MSRKPRAIEVSGIVLKCQHCGHDEFRSRSAQLNTAGATLLGLDWANQSAACHVCDRCGFIHLFLPEP